MSHNRWRVLSRMDHQGSAVSEFQVPVVDNSGKVIHREVRRAHCMVEHLSGGLCLELVEIPGGTFRMGTPESQIQRVIDAFEIYIARPKIEERARRQTPYHSVQIPAFWMAKFPVTQRQWRMVASFPRVKIELDAEPSHFDSENFPIETITWEEAMEFCARLSTFSGKSYRLPTEAEWEYACRGGTDTEFYFGNTLTSELVNYDGNYPYGLNRKDLYRMTPTPVGSLPNANQFGLYDMIGNVWEWCLDIWHPNYEGAPADGSPWLKGGHQTYRVARGGSWRINGVECRSANRDRVSFNKGNEYVGLRPVMSNVSY